MRTHALKLFTFNELSDDAKEHARNKYREKNYEIDWQHEIFCSFKKTFIKSGLHITDYSLGLNSYSYVKFDMDENIRKLTGSRALAWLENNLFSKLRITRAEYMKNRKDYLS